jgi:hypothetical protein
MPERARLLFETMAEELFSSNAGNAGDAAADRRHPAAEIERLHRLLDKQPSCLMRAGIDGTLLAVSDTTVVLLGGQALAQVLGTNFVDRLRGDAQAWADFVHRVNEGGSGSAEFEMDDLRGGHRTVTLLGAAAPDHPDGLASLLVAVRATATARRLETSLQEQEGARRSLQASLDEATATMQALRERLEHAATERRQLRAALDASVAECQEIAASVDQLAKALSAAVDAASVARLLLAKQASK